MLPTTAAFGLDLAHLTRGCLIEMAHCDLMKQHPQTNNGPSTTTEMAYTMAQLLLSCKITMAFYGLQAVHHKGQLSRAMILSKTPNGPGKSTPTYPMYQASPLAGRLL